MNLWLPLNKLPNKIQLGRILTTRISNLCLLLFSSDEEEEEEEEMLISEEEIPFKDDPRDETYKPHLERHVSDFTPDMSMKNKLGKHRCMLLFSLVARLMSIDLILNE